jgi:hypothetical protein
MSNKMKGKVFLGAVLMLGLSMATSLYAAGPVTLASLTALAVGTTPSYTAGTAISSSSVTGSFGTLYGNIPTTNTDLTNLYNNEVLLNNQLGNLNSSQWSVNSNTLDYAGGNIGIGTTTPSSLLSVLGGNIEIGSGQNIGYAVSIGSGQFTYQSHTLGCYAIGWYLDSSFTSADSGYISGFGGLKFFTGNNPIMTIGNNGLVGIATTTPQYVLDVAGYIHTPYSVVVSSDRRLKKDIATLPDALDDLTKLRGVTFHWIDPTKGIQLQYGVIAQEVEAIYPDLVITDKDGIKSVNYNGFVAPLIESVKELKCDSDQKDQEIASLKQGNAELEKRLAAIEAKLGM